MTSPTYRLYIDGTWQDSEGDAVLSVLNPATEEVIGAGMVYVNGGGAGSSPHTAFGGYKQSGLGLERGEYGLDEFLLSKSIIWSARWHVTGIQLPVDLGRASR